MTELVIIYKCPKCSKSLFRNGNAYKCVNNHNYDLARDGYVNLILANRKRSLISGDNKEMILSRYNFLKTGSYKFLLDNIIQQIKLTPFINPVILDIGCGSGYYISEIRNYFRKSRLFGSDVSKNAISFCSRKFSDINFVVGNSYDLPFTDNSIDVLLSVFSPFKEAEAERVIKKNGIFIMVRPGEKHLNELYKELSIPFKEKKSIQFEKMYLENTLFVSQRETVTPEKLKNLITMTPLFWKIPVKTQESLNIREISYNFVVYVYKK